MKLNIRFFKNLMPKHDFSKRLRAKFLFEQGHSMRQISKMLNVTRKFAKTWVSRDNIERKVGSGREAKLTRPILKKIKKNLQSKNRNSLRKTAAVVGFSTTTIHRARKKLSLKPYRLQYSPLIKNVDAKKEVNICKDKI